MKITIWDIENGKLKEWCKEQFNRSNIPKYRKYFDEWWRNLTLQQKLYFFAYSRGEKTYLTNIEA